MSEKITYRIALEEWIQQWDGHASTTRTRKDGRTNLNPILRVHDGELRVDMGWWWLWVGGKPAEYSAFNSRDDRLLRSWAGPFRSRRALLPATWYQERGKVFRLPDGSPFMLAAIYNTTPQDDGVLISYSMVTRTAVGDAKDAHPDRMPMLLPADFQQTWLDPERVGDADLVTQAQTASEDLSHTVTYRIPETPGLF